MKFNMYRKILQIKSIGPQQFFSLKCSIRLQRLCSSVIPAEELLDIFQPPEKPPEYNTDLIPEKKVKITKKSQSISSLKEENIIIQCKRPEFNHYKNQTYEKFTPLPLASKGWHHNKSIGDYFTIKICDEENYVKNLFWPDTSTTFSSLPLSEDIVKALNNIGINHPTSVQVEAIPKILSGKNCLLSAETGCGKTLAFLLPALQQVLKWSPLCSNRPPNTPLVLILTPSRELAEQIRQVAKGLIRDLPITCNVLVGGRTKQRMLNPHFQHCDILIATIGAMSKLTTTGIYEVGEVKHLILDESDCMLDDSFNELLLRFLKKFKVQFLPHLKDGVPKHTQLTLVSATLPTSLYDILREFVEPGSFMKITTSRIHKVMPHVPQTFYKLGVSQKPTKLLQLAKETLKKNQPMLIFSNKAKTSDWISLMLNENGVKATSLNGEMPQIIRRGIFDEFQQGHIDILSCTDIASRGLDTTRVEHIINYDFPLYMADYIHRCGRTGRVGSPLKCLVSSFVSGRREVDLLQKIETAVRSMDELPNVNANITKIIKYRVLKGTKK